MDNLKLSRMEYGDYTNVKDISSALLKDIRMQSLDNKVPIPVPIDSIAMSLDIASIDPLPSKIKSFEGVLLKKDWQGFIFFNGLSPLSRQRFTIGHELGHWMIPSHLTGDQLSCTKQQISNSYTKGQAISKEIRIEIEANRFSAQILMPEKEFRIDTNKNEPDLRHIFAVSQKYNVSMVACCLRFRDLSDYSCAIIQHHNFIIKRIFKTKSFPNLDRNFKENGFISPKSLSASNSFSKELIPIDWRIWLQQENPNKTELYEQVLQQRDGYRITLLYLDDSQSVAEEDMEEELSSLWNPRFK